MQFILCCIWNWVVGKFAQRGMLFAIRRGMKPKCIKAETKKENVSQELRTRKCHLVLLSTERSLLHRKCRWNFKNRSLVLLYNAIRVKIKLHIVKTVGSKYSGFFSDIGWWWLINDINLKFLLGWYEVIIRDRGEREENATGLWN